MEYVAIRWKTFLTLNETNIEELSPVEFIFRTLFDDDYPVSDLLQRQVAMEVMKEDAQLLLPLTVWNYYIDAVFGPAFCGSPCTSNRNVFRLTDEGC